MTPKQIQFLQSIIDSLQECAINRNGRDLDQIIAYIDSDARSLASLVTLLKKGYANVT